MTHTTEQLKDLLAMGEAGYSGAFDHLEKIAPTLAAELVRLREALGDMLFEYGGMYDEDCLMKDSHTLAMIERARQALDGARAT